MTNFKIRLLLVFLTVSAHYAAAAENGKLCIVNSANKTVQIEVEIARTDAERNRGLMYRKNLPWNRGMFFVFQRERVLNFWMKNTSIPLSIAYIDRFGIIREMYDMKPLDTSVTYMSKNDVMYALEVNQGWFRRNNISPGCKVILHGCIGK